MYVCMYVYKSRFLAIFSLFPLRFRSLQGWVVDGPVLLCSIFPETQSDIVGTWSDGEGLLRRDAARLPELRQSSKEKEMALLTVEMMQGEMFATWGQCVDVDYADFRLIIYIKFLCFEELGAFETYISGDRLAHIVDILDTVHT